MSYRIEVSETFSAAHQLRGYQGKCENLHGHNWKVDVVISADELDAAGLAIDFTEVKRLLAGVLKNLDHTCLNRLPYFQKENPTSENIARYIYGEFKSGLSGRDVRVSAVSVWESDRCRATYTE